MEQPMTVAVAWAGPVDPVRPVQTGVKPLRAVGRAHLVHQHVADLIVKRLRVLRSVEISMLLTPMPPAKPPRG